MQVAFEVLVGVVVAMDVVVVPLDSAADTSVGELEALKAKFEVSPMPCGSADHFRLFVRY